AFTAEELAQVELVLHNRESLISHKAVAGRAMERRDRLRIQEPDPQPTIACVTGFLVNMVKRTIALITPARATPARPLGYDVFAERTFDGARAFRAALDEMIAIFMRTEIGA